MDKPKFPTFWKTVLVACLMVIAYCVVVTIRFGDQRNHYTDCIESATYVNDMVEQACRTIARSRVPY